MRDAGWTNYVIVHINIQLTLFDQRTQKRGEVGGSRVGSRARVQSRVNSTEQ